MLPCNDYVVLDLETTGLNAKKNKIIEIGAVRVRSGQIVKRFSTLVRPGCKLEPRITRLTGITDEELEKAPAIVEVIDAFLEFAGNDVLLGHGIKFDYSFMKRAVVNYAKIPEFERMGLDTLAISRKYLSELPSRRLCDLCRYFEIAHKPHRALDDAEATHGLYQKLLETVFYADYDWQMDFTPKPLLYKVKKEAPVMKKQIEWLNRAFQYHGIIPEYDVNMLTKNEASREMDRIIQTYGRF